MIEPQTLPPHALLLVSLAIGLLIGLERGWELREEPEGGRVAGVRTFALIGLAGGCAALLGGKESPWVVGAGLIATAIVVAVAYMRRAQAGHDIGFTSAFACILTFALGAMAVRGYPLLAAAAAVVATMLLAFKPTLHGWVRKLDQRELRATLQLLLISVVLLPILPDKGFGPYGVLNPYQIWWMVVLIAGLSYLGYFAMRIGGASYGALVTGITGGLASSTAVTLSLARVSGKKRGLETPLAAGILASGATMYPRMLVLASIMNPSLFDELLIPFAAMAAGTYAEAAFAWWRGKHSKTLPEPELENPFQLLMAVRFALLLVAILFLSHVLVNNLGQKSLYILAAASGIGDVDAITLTISQMVPEGVALSVGALAVIAAAASNGISKSLIAWFVGGAALGWRIGLGLLMPVALGAVLYLVSP